MYSAAPLTRNVATPNWSMPRLRLPTMPTFGLRIVDATIDRTLNFLCERLSRGENTRVAFLNAHCVNVAAHNADYQLALASADTVLPDGSGIDLAVRMHGRRLSANLNGTDLVPALCQRLARSGDALFLLGGHPGVAADAARALQIQCPGLRIAGTRDGYFAAGEESDVIQQINASGASVLLVAMGVPQQDIWLAKCHEELAPTLRFGVGGLFDFLSGRIPRAPRALRATGMEWTYRLYQEPARMWRRYVIGNPEFIMRAALDALSSRGVSSRVDLALKRLLDITGAGVALLLSAPLLLLAMAAIRLTSPGPALLRQTRVGENGLPFTMIKLRSMYVDADIRRAALVAQNEHGADGLTFKLKQDPRITSIGRFLRKSSIDELPQLWNVLMGDMSLVGPRPQLPTEVARYAAVHFKRLAAKPGLTCLWQISGRANLPFERQFELDVSYLQSRSILTDLRILLMTFPAVLRARGAY